MRECTVTFPGGGSVKAPAGTEYAAFAARFGGLPGTLAAVRVNNEAQPLSARLEVSAALSPVMLESAEGAVIHRHTLSFALCAAAALVFPHRRLRVGHSLGNSYYFSFHGGRPPAAAELDALKNAVRALITRDVPIERKILPFEEAVERFQRAGLLESARLLEQNASAIVTLNTLDEYAGLYTCPLLPRTGILGKFDITPYGDGFLLRYPSPDSAAACLTLPAVFTDQPGIFAVFKESKKWGRIAGVYAAAGLNDLVVRREIREFIRIAEGFSDRRLSRIADAVYTRRKDIKIVLIAGPSSSGKTTTAKRLAVHLKTLGMEPDELSLDDFYLPPSAVPRDEKGAPDFECLEALDVPFLNEKLLAILSGAEVTLPRFDFKTGTRKEGRTLRLGRRSILVLEGIHGLNPALTPNIEAKNTFKLYVSALTALNLDDHNRIATTDNRLLRRLVRDYQFRGVGAERTLSMWPGVQRGAEKYIFTFQNEADAVFNSALDYEIAVLKLYAEPLLRSVRPSSPVFSEASRLGALLGSFYPIPSEYVPSLSILREFIGGGEFKY